MSLTLNDGVITDSQHLEAPVVTDGVIQDVSASLDPVSIQNTLRVPQPDLGQTHSLDPVSIQNTPRVSEINLEEIGALSPNPVKVAPRVGPFDAPKINEFDAVPLEVRTLAGSILIGQTHSLNPELIHVTTRTGRPDLAGGMVISDHWGHADKDYGITLFSGQDGETRVEGSRAVTYLDGYDGETRIEGSHGVTLLIDI